MSERSAQIIRLLETRDDHLPLPSRRDHSTSGFVHNAPARRSCPDCLANDRRMFGCETCGGRGYIEEHRAHDPYAKNDTRAFGLTGASHDVAHARDSQIAHAGRLANEMLASLSDELEAANENPYGWEEARRRMYDQFDYESLDAQLEVLRIRDEGAYRALHAVYVYKWAEPSAGYEWPCARGLVFLHQHLPTPLRSPLAVVRQGPVLVGKLERGAGAAARELRDNEIRELADQGLKPQEIAQRCRVSIRTVYNIVNAEQVA